MTGSGATGLRTEPRSRRERSGTEPSGPVSMTRDSSSTDNRTAAIERLSSDGCISILRVRDERRRSGSHSPPSRLRFHRYSSYHDTELCKRMAFQPGGLPLVMGCVRRHDCRVRGSKFAREDRTYIRLRRQLQVTLSPNSCARCGFETESASSDAERDSRTASKLSLHLRNRSRNDRRVLTEDQ